MLRLRFHGTIEIHYTVWICSAAVGHSED